MEFLRKFMIRFIRFCGFALVGLLALQAVRIGLLSMKTPKGNIPFERIRPDAQLKILFIGDSTARGTGAKDNRESVAGWFGQDFPEAHIINHGRNGKKAADLVYDFHPGPEEHYNLAVIQIGANDILWFTNLISVEKDLTIVIDRAQAVADHVIILHSGNIGLSPIFTWPLSWLYTERSRALRALYMKIAIYKDVQYVDLFAERENDLFLKDIPRYYAPDLLHPSGAGYRWWYERIRETLKSKPCQRNCIPIPNLIPSM